MSIQNCCVCAHTLVFIYSTVIAVFFCNIYFIMHAHMHGILDPVPSHALISDTLPIASSVHLDEIKTVSEIRTVSELLGQVTVHGIKRLLIFGEVDIILMTGYVFFGVVVVLCIFLH